MAGEKYDALEVVLVMGARVSELFGQYAGDVYQQPSDNDCANMRDVIKYLNGMVAGTRGPMSLDNLEPEQAQGLLVHLETARKITENLDLDIIVEVPDEVIAIIQARSDATPVDP